MNDWQKKNCRICEHMKNKQGGYCYMFENEPDEHCKQVKIAPPKNGRPQRVPFPPSKPVA